MVERILITQDDRPVSEIIIGRQIVAAPRLGTLFGEAPKRRNVAVLTQPTVRHIADEISGLAAAAGLDVDVLELPDRDEAKDLSVAEGVYAWLNGRRLTRHDTIIGIGGGAATDLAGFVAATYLRGVEAVLVPTTLLGAVDASIGGKTAVNVGGKNLVGVFRHPSRVVIDLQVLEGLPIELLREGAAEALKTGLIGDPVLVEQYATDGLAAPLDVVVPRSVRVKAAVVSDDFEERGAREYLNYGHTVGHAVETLTGLPHGHSVAVGMVAAGFVSEQTTGFPDASAQRSIIEALGLPTRVDGLETDEVVTAMELDKKRDEAGLRMVLLEAIGHPTVKPVDDATVRAALGAVGIT